MPLTSPVVQAPSTEPIYQPAATQRQGQAASASRLSCFAAAVTSGPRAVLRGIASAVSLIGRHLAAMTPGAARLRSQERASRDLDTKIGNLITTMRVTAREEHAAERIGKALDGAQREADTLKRSGGSPREVSATLTAQKVERPHRSGAAPPVGCPPEPDDCDRAAE